MNKIQKRLYEYADERYADFEVKLTPGIDRKNVFGVRLPFIRSIAKEYVNDADCGRFLKELPHKYFDENVLHSAILSVIKDSNECLEKIEEFLPYVDNWMVCDSLIPKCLSKNKEGLMNKIEKWTKSKKTYTCRFGIKALMMFYLDDDYKVEYLQIPSNIHSKEYYVNMMIAWYYAEACVKHWDDAIVYLEDNRLDKWVHNKAIQKAIESFRISDEYKNYLRTLRRK